LQRGGPFIGGSGTSRILIPDLPALIHSADCQRTGLFKKGDISVHDSLPDVNNDPRCRF
jgi:hypothetical protein